MHDFNPDTVAPPREPWGVWPTLSISGLILVVFFLTGSLISLLFLGWALQTNPALLEQGRQADALRKVAESGNVLALTTLVSGMIGLGGIGIAIRLRRGWRFQDYLNLYWPQWSTFAIWNGLLLVLVVIEEMIVRFFAQQSDFLKEILASDQTNLFWLSLAVVGMAPFFEEIFFRGFMFKGMEKSWVGTAGTIALTSFIWTIIHVQYNFFFLSIIFSLGLLFGYARHVTKSLWVPISMHVLNNGLAMVGSIDWLQGGIFH